MAFTVIPEIEREADTTVRLAHVGIVCRIAGLPHFVAVAHAVAVGVRTVRDADL